MLFRKEVINLSGSDCYALHCTVTMIQPFQLKAGRQALTISVEHDLNSK